MASRLYRIGLVVRELRVRGRDEPSMRQPFGIDFQIEAPYTGALAAMRGAKTHLHRLYRIEHSVRDDKMERPREHPVSDAGELYLMLLDVLRTDRVGRMGLTQSEQAGIAAVQESLWNRMGEADQAVVEAATERMKQLDKDEGAHD